MADQRQTAAACQHCHTPVVRDRRGAWIHASLSYPCRDRWGTILPTSAEPAPAREPADTSPEPDCDIGTVHAHREHQRRGEAPCRPCADAWNAHQRQHRQQATGLPDGDPRHGTPGGYVYHRCRCDACRAANRARGQRRLCGCDACRARRARGQRFQESPRTRHASGEDRTTAIAAIPETLCDLVGHVGAHEAVTIVAAIIDMHSGRPFTPADLSDHIRDAVQGFDVWVPTPQVVDNYCRYTLATGGIVEPVTAVGRYGWLVRAYRSRATGNARTRRLRVYDALAGWGLRHPTVSVQQVIGPPRGGHGRPTPAHLRLPMYAMLLGNPGQFVGHSDLHRDLTAVVASDRVPASWFQQTIYALTENKILISRPRSGEPATSEVTIAPAWVAPISDLLRSLAGPHGGHGDERSHRVCAPGSQVLGNPDTIADLLTKAARFSSSIIGQRRGTSVTANDIYEIIRSRPDPTSPHDIVDALTRAGRPISRSRVSAYLRALADAGMVTALAGAGQPGIHGKDRHGYVATPARSAPRAARGQRPAPQ